MQETIDKQHKKIDIRDVAAAAGCSIATVSNVLNSTGRVGAKTRERVLRTVKELGYAPNAAGKMLKSQRTENIGFLFYPSCEHIFTNRFYSEVMDGVEEVLSENNFNLLIAGCRFSEERFSLPKFVRERSVDGLMLLGIVPKAFAQQLLMLDYPFVQIDNVYDEIPMDSVVSDGFNGAKMAVEYLIENGHRDIVMFASDRNVGSTNARFEGYKAALQKHDIPFRPAYVINTFHGERGGAPAAQELIKRHLNFSAIFAVNDEVAITAVPVLKEAGYRIPEDISIIGFDNIEKATLVNPPLTTVHIDKRLMGNLGAQAILARIENPTRHVQNTVLPGTLVVRQSVARISQDH